MWENFECLIDTVYHDVVMIIMEFLVFLGRNRFRGLFGVIFGDKIRFLVKKRLRVRRGI